MHLLQRRGGLISMKHGQERTNKALFTPFNMSLACCKWLGLGLWEFGSRTRLYFQTRDSCPALTCIMGCQQHVVDQTVNVIFFTCISKTLWNIFKKATDLNGNDLSSSSKESVHGYTSTRLYVLFCFDVKLTVTSSPSFHDNPCCRCLKIQRSFDFRNGSLTQAKTFLSFQTVDTYFSLLDNYVSSLSGRYSHSKTFHFCWFAVVVEVNFYPGFRTAVFGMLAVSQLLKNVSK